MNENADPAADPPERGVLRHRVTEHRRRLGLSEAELATRSGMAPRYLRHLLDEEADFDPNGVHRVAAALQLSYEELLQGPADPPPGQTGAAPRPELAHLTVDECWAKLGTHGVGRVAVPAEPSPDVLPVNYGVDAGTIVYRTEPHGPAALDTGANVSFQVDRIDDRTRGGWSVLITGTAERIDDRATVRGLAEDDVIEPWAGGDRPLWIRIRPRTTTGRQVESV